MVETIRTLIVEDNKTFSQAMKSLLHSRFSSMTVEECRSGRCVLEKVRAFAPDLIFMDIKLDGENGLEITKKIREAQCPAVVIILTSYDLQEYREAAARCGADHFVSKGTCTAKEILNLVESVFSETKK